MRSSFLKNSSCDYFDFCDLLTEHYSSLAQQSLILGSMSQAVLEVTESLAQTYSHKLAIGLIDSGSWVCQQLAKSYSRRGYQVQALKVSEISKAEEWVSGLKKETLFIFVERDNVLTGELFPIEVLIKESAEKKIFSVILSSTEHFYFPIQKMRPYELRILKMDENKSLCLSGARTKIDPMFTPYGFKREMVQNFSWSLEQQNQELISSVEGKCNSFFKIFFASPEMTRIYDRLVIYQSEVDGSALIDELQKNLEKSSSKSLDGGGAVSLCGHPDQINFNGMGLSDKLSENELRGLIVVPVSWLVDDFMEHLEATLIRVKELGKFHASYGV